MDTESLRPYLADPHRRRQALIVLVMLAAALLLLTLGAAILVGSGVNPPAGPELLAPFRWSSLETLG